MNRTFLIDQAWSQTFPHLVSIRENEWLVGILLRCDENNFWKSGTTLSYLLGPLHKRELARHIELLSEVQFKKLARALAVPLSSIVATIQQEELLHSHSESGRPTVRTHSSFPLHLCPLCIEESRFLARTLALPGTTYCPQHYVSLVITCQCGAALLPFNPNALPFTCPTCGLHWEDLPYEKANPKHIEAEQKSLSLAPISTREEE